MHRAFPTTAISVLVLSAVLALGTAVFAPSAHADESSCGVLAIDRSDGLLVGVAPLVIDLADGTRPGVVLIIDRSDGMFGTASVLRINRADGTVEGPTLRIDKDTGVLEGAVTLTVDRDSGALSCGS